MYLIRRTISEAIQENAGELQGKVLDYGCGSRPYEHFFKNVEYVGADVEVSGHPSDRKRADVYFDGTTLPFPNDHFEGILASEVIEHVMHLPECLAELHRVLRPGGKILVTCPFVWPLHEIPYDFARYTPYALEQEFSKSGFKVVKSARLGTPIEAVAQMFVIECLPLLINFLVPTNFLRRNAGKLGMGLTFGICSLLTRLHKGASTLYLTNLLVAVKVDEPGRTSSPVSKSPHE